MFACASEETAGSKHLQVTVTVRRKTWHIAACGLSKTWAAQRVEEAALLSSPVRTWRSILRTGQLVGHLSFSVWIVILNNVTLKNMAYVAVKAGLRSCLHVCCDNTIWCFVSFRRASNLPARTCRLFCAPVSRRDLDSVCNWIWSVYWERL